MYLISGPSGKIKKKSQDASEVEMSDLPDDYFLDADDELVDFLEKQERIVFVRSRSRIP